MKSYQKSNLFAILVLLLFSVSFLTPFITPTPVSAYEPFAVLTPLGSQIQVYTNPAGCNADYGDTKILNSYTNLVDTPSFCIYISNPNNQTHSLVLDMFAEVTVTIPVYDPSIHGYVSQNKTSYSDLIVPQYNRTVKNDDTTGYNTYLIDKNVWGILSSQVKKVEIVLHYDGYTGIFFYKTSFSNQPFNTTFGNIYVDALLLLIISLVLTSSYIGIFHRQARKQGGIFPKYDPRIIGFWAFILIFFMLVIFALMQQAVFSAYNTLGWAGLIIFYLILTGLAGFMITGWTSNKNLYKVEVTEVQGVPFHDRSISWKKFIKQQSELRQKASLELQHIQDNSDVNVKDEWLSPKGDKDASSSKPVFISHPFYQYIDHNGNKRYMVQPNSLGEMIARRFNGGINLNFKGAEVFEGHPVNEGDTEYTKEYIFCRAFKETPKGIWANTIKLPNGHEIHVTSIIYWFLGFISLLTFVYGFVAPTIILWAIDLVVFLFAFGTLVMMYVIKSSGISYDIQFKPLSQNEVMAAFDMMRTFQMNQENKGLLNIIQELVMRMDKIAYNEWMRSQLRWNIEQYPDNIRDDIDEKLHDAISTPNHYDDDDFTGDADKRIERLTRKYMKQYSD